MEYLDQKQNLLRDRIPYYFINLDKISEHALTEINLTTEEILCGLTKMYYGNLDNENKYFKNIIIQHFTDKSNMICLINYDFDELIIKSLIDDLFDNLGHDINLRGRLTQTENDSIKFSDKNVILREWNFSDYYVKLNMDTSDKILSLNMLSLNLNS